MPMGIPQQHKHGTVNTKNPTLNNTENKATNPSLALARTVPATDPTTKTIPVKYQLARFQPKGLFGHTLVLFLGGMKTMGVGWKL
jgi:hypothetical protein